MWNFLKNISIILLFVACVPQTEDLIIENNIDTNTVNIINLVDSTVYQYETRYRYIDTINTITIYDTVTVEQYEYIPEIVYEYKEEIITVYDTVFIEVQYCKKDGFLCKLLCGKK